MFIRKKKNPSGSITVQIVDKSRGYKILETLGTSYDLEEIEDFFVEAKRKIDEEYSSQGLLFDDIIEEEVIIETFIKSLKSKNIIVYGPELIFGKIFDRIGFNVVPEELFRHLVISRLVYPTSKLKTIDYVRRYRHKEYSIDSIYRFLDKLNSKYKKELEDISFSHTKKILGKISVVFYDVTTLYFEAEDEDDLRKIGFSKDGKFQCPQIQIGLLVGLDGYPIAYDIFEGNAFEGNTLIPIINSFEKRYNISKPVIIADSGLLSKNNIDILDSNNYDYIIGARIKNEKKEIKEEILEKSKAMENGESFYLSKSDKIRLIISYSDSRARKDEYNRKKGLRRLEKYMKMGRLTKESINNRGYNKFLKIHDKIKISLNNEKIEEDKKWDGLKGYITNTLLPPNLVIDNYKHLWQIEKAFRISKTDLKIRPIYHRNKYRIEAHICICFVAYSIYKELERILKENNSKLSPKKVAEISQTMYQIEYKSLRTKRTKKFLIDSTYEEEKEILDIMSKYS